MRLSPNGGLNREDQQPGPSGNNDGQYHVMQNNDSFAQHMQSSNTIVSVHTHDHLIINFHIFRSITHSKCPLLSILIMTSARIKILVLMTLIRFMRYVFNGKIEVQKTFRTKIDIKMFLKNRKVRKRVRIVPESEIFTGRGQLICNI